MKFSIHKLVLITSIFLILILLLFACSGKNNDEFSTGSILSDNSNEQAVPETPDSPAASEQAGGNDNSAVSGSDNTSDNAAAESTAANSAAENPVDNADAGAPGTDDSGNNAISNNNTDSASKSTDSQTTSDNSNSSSSDSIRSSGSNTSDSKGNNTASDSNNTTQDKQTTESGQASDATETTGTGNSSDAGTSSDNEAVTEGNGRVIAIDAGHQSKGNYDEEPIGPGSDITKPKVSSGTQGAFTGIPEYKLNLAVAKKVEKELIARGYKVIMIRETNRVNISNKERAEIANDSGADLFIRIHADGSTNSSVNGTSTLYPSKDNPFVPELSKDSYSLAKSIVDAICDSTGGKNRGAIAHDDMSGINWCTIPVTIIEMGYMTNEKEDHLMQTEDYQDKIVQGICNGIDDYFD